MPSHTNPEIQKAAASKYPADRLRAEDASISKLKKRFKNSVEAATTKTAWDNIADLIKSRAEIDKILDEIEWPEYAPGADLDGLYLTIGDIQADHIADIVRAKAFKPRSRAAEWLSKFGADEIKYIDESQKEAIRNILARCYEDGSYHRMSWQVKNFIGLDPGRADALQTYANDLMAQELPEKAVWGLTEVRGQELLMDRAMVIAQNECLTASRQASADVTAEATERGILDPDEQEGVWLTVADQPGMGDDGHICDACRAAGGSTRELPDGIYEASGTQFTELHIGDRCIESIRPKIKKSLDISDVHVPHLEVEGDRIPYPNYHSARIADPDQFDPDSFRNKELPKSEGGKGGVQIIMGKRKGGGGSMEVTSYRFPVDKYTPAEAKAWLKANDVTDYEFESAKEVEKAANPMLSAIMDRLDDETEGIASYTKIIAACKDAGLKKILQGILVDEKSHLGNLREWLENNNPDALEEHDAGIEKAESHSREYLDAFHSAVMDHPYIHQAFKNEAHKAARAAAGGRLRPRGADEPEEADVGEAETDEELEAEKCDTVKKFYNFPIYKLDQDKQIVYGVVLEPDTEDLQGDRISAAEIEKAAHAFMQKSRLIKQHHKSYAEAEVIESYIAPDNVKMNDQLVRKGSWVLATKIHDKQLWKQVKSREITGFSIGGRGQRTPV